MINNNPLDYIEQTVAVEDLLIAGVSRKLRNDIGYDLVYLSSPNDFELTTAQAQVLSLLVEPHTVCLYNLTGHS